MKPTIDYSLSKKELVKLRIQFKEIKYSLIGKQDQTTKEILNRIHSIELTIDRRRDWINL